MKIDDVIISDDIISNIIKHALKSKCDWCSKDVNQFDIMEVLQGQLFDIEEQDNGSGEAEIHNIDSECVIVGLEAMKSTYPEEFALLISGELNDELCDTFLQCVVLGDVIYH